MNICRPVLRARTVRWRGARRPMVRLPVGRRPMVGGQGIRRMDRRPDRPLTEGRPTDLHREIRRQTDRQGNS
jgi:hypothetical protein